MKKIGIIIGIFALATSFTGCTSAYYASAGYAGDDLYALHDRAQIARKQQAKAEAEKAAADARRAEWEARIAEAKAAAAENSYYEYNSNPYEEVLADSYESAYARRLRGFESPTYKMPSSYYNFRYGSTFNYVSAYDPAFYNIIVMGDQVWVEPKYITSMFGTWGSVVYADPWYYGWNRPWGPSFSVGSWGWSFGWNSWHNPWSGPWYGGWYDPWYRPGWGWGPGWHGHHHWAGGGSIHRPGPGYRPSYRPSTPSAPTFGGRTRRNVNQATGSGRTWTSGVYQGGGTNNRNGSSSGVRQNRVTRNDSNSGSSTSWSGSERSTGRRTATSGSTTSGYNSGTSRSGSYSGGGYSGGYSGGSSRSGSSTGSSSRSR